jgi:hypothetical protein
MELTLSRKGRNLVLQCEITLIVIPGHREALDPESRNCLALNHSEIPGSAANAAAPE